ncbi:uncharacterized protein [Mytilus edulis]|uniref:uncharacterized protein n=1 Tax=Mytilus edulis TaxID=6550 RepID=UPI0039EF4287
MREIQTATVPILKYNPSESELNISKLVPDLGSIMVEGVQVPMHVLDIDQQGQFLVRDERKLSLTHSFPTTKLGNEVSIGKGCFIPDDRLLLCQNQSKTLFVCKPDGSNSSVINLNDLPIDICLYDKNHAVVSLGDKGIQIIDLTSLKSGRIIKVKGFCGVITSVKDKIWVNNDDHTLTIIDIDGKVLKVQDIQTTCNPYDICANQDGDVYCTEVYHDKLSVVTSDGKVREIYNSPDLKGPTGVAVDDRGDVYVAGWSSINIHRIANDGQKHDIVMTAEDGISLPTALSYNDETKELLVINDNFKSVKIYKTQ